MKGERESYVRVLDYLPHGHPEDPHPAYKKRPIIHVVGEDHFTLLELVPREHVVPQVYERLYIGEGERDKIDHVKKRLMYKELTHGAKVELPYALEQIVKENEKRFIKFFNEAQPLTTRLHTFGLLPGVGKKLMWTILEERKKKPFESFEDIAHRVKGLYHPEKVIVKRIEEELSDEHVKYKLFTK